MNEERVYVYHKRKDYAIKANLTIHCDTKLFLRYWLTRLTWLNITQKINSLKVLYKTKISILC